MILLSVILNLTYFLELEIKYVNFSTNIDNTTLYDEYNTTSVEVNNVTTYTEAKILESNSSNIEPETNLGYTDLGQHPYYLKYYKIYVRLIVSGIVPFSLLIYFNSSIYTAIKKNNRLRRRLTLSEPLSRLVSVQSGASESSRSPTNFSFRNSFTRRPSHKILVSTNRREEDSLSMAFVVIVSVFLFCNILKFGLNFYDGINGTVGHSDWSRIVGYFSNLLVVLNSSMNMVIYCIMNNKFKRHFLTTLKSALPSTKRSCQETHM